MLQEKKAALAKRARLDIAELVEHGKHESARVKTESLIVDDVRFRTNKRCILSFLNCLNFTARHCMLDLHCWR